LNRNSLGRSSFSSRSESIDRLNKELIKKLEISKIVSNSRRKSKRRESEKDY
jgi:hypothetical protein